MSLLVLRDLALMGLLVLALVTTLFLLAATRSRSRTPPDAGR
jgi:multisubunit Na+/H+ antiporter MnhB subunit